MIYADFHPELACDLLFLYEMEEESLGKGRTVKARRREI